MELYGTYSRSIPQKIVIHLIGILILWLAYWILFKGGANVAADKLHIRNAAYGEDRRKLIFVFNSITFIRLAYMMFFLLKRKIPWEESISVPFAFAIYFIGYALFVLPTSMPIDGIDIFAIALFISGAVLNSGGEILRDKWKKDLANRGKLYTGGFFKYARHINYFGDILWVTAYAIATRNWYATAIPVFIFCFFAFYNAPKLDAYLNGKYGKDYSAYAQRTKMLIPFIY